MTDIDKQDAINELTAKATDDIEVSSAIKEISETTGFKEKDVLKAFINMEVDKELKAREETKSTKKTIKE